MFNKLLFCISILLFGQENIHAQSKKDRERLRDVQPVMQLYDSLVRKAGWFYMTTYQNSMNCTYAKRQNKNHTCSCSGARDEACEALNIGQKDLERLYALMKQARCLEVASTTWPDMNHYSIRIVYQLKTFKKYSFVFAIGEQAIESSRKNPQLVPVGIDSYKEVYSNR